MFFESEPDKNLTGKPSVINIRNEVLCNTNFRKEIWTGKHLQVTVMNIPVGGEIGLEMHDSLDQFIKVESGCANLYFGNCKQSVKFAGKITQDCAVLVPAGTWHNIINACAYPLKVYSIYAPPQHPVGTIHKTKLDSDLTEH